MVSRRLSATGIRFSVILFPPGSWALLTVGLPANDRTPTGLPRSARTSCDRGGRPLYPGDGGAHPDRSWLPAGACRFAAAGPCTRRHIPSTGSRLTRHQRGFKPFARPVFPSPVATRMERAALGLFVPGFAPRRPGAERRTPGWGQAIEHGPGTTAQLTSFDLQSGSSLNACDLASHATFPITRTSSKHDRVRDSRPGQPDRARAVAAWPTQMCRLGQQHGRWCGGRAIDGAQHRQVATCGARAWSEPARHSRRETQRCR